MPAALRTNDPEIDFWSDRRMAECRAAFRRNVREPAMQTRAAQSWSLLEDLGYEHDPIATDHPAVVEHLNEAAIQFQAATARIAMAIDPEATVPADLDRPVPASCSEISTAGERALVTVGLIALLAWGSAALISKYTRFDILGLLLP
jgi:hypothetical protein